MEILGNLKELVAYKIDRFSRLSKAMSLTYEKVPYSLSCLSQCLVKLEDV